MATHRRRHRHQTHNRFRFLIPAISLISGAILILYAFISLLAPSPHHPHHLVRRTSLNDNVVADDSLFKVPISGGMVSDRSLWSTRMSKFYFGCSNASNKFPKVETVTYPNRFLLIATSGGLNQQRTGITDAVVAARILNATLVVPKLDQKSFWKDSSTFSEIFDVDWFISHLSRDVKVIKELPRKGGKNLVPYNMRVPRKCNERCYQIRVLPVLLKKRAVQLSKFDYRLSNKLDTDLQKLRCRGVQANVIAPGIINYLSESSSLPSRTCCHVAMANRNSAYSISPEELVRLRQLLNSPQTFSANSGTSSKPNSSWVIDSGATHHMTGNRGILSSLHDVSHSPVRLADGSSCSVLGIGSISNSKNLNMSSVLFVPKFPDSLCSVSQITKQNNCSVTFYPTHCVFQELGTNRVIGTGVESNGLYRLSMLSCPMANICDSSVREAHCRLGHPSAAALRKMRPDISIPSDFHCESCQLGKHTRRPYPPKVSSRASTLFELVHSDIWGPCPTKTPLGFQYFVSFIDDYSRATWVYLLKSRSEVSSIFREFHSYVQNQFNTSIKTLRSDNAKEYLSTEFFAYL
ncbi:hypothetical protein SSX86_020126 [Deinandra increscens subsp. villosa]|uniref:O-fucosyltransferase family protein n=1 Tax=Deinandra increscens subsp. villosa TaxID=3103831 RepID=A0AAP0CTW8_9ASTR